MKSSHLVATSCVSSATLFLLWLSPTEHAHAFSAVSPSLLGGKKAVNAFARRGLSPTSANRRGDTKIFMEFEPLPIPGVPHKKPETKIVEKEVYDEPEAEEGQQEDEHEDEEVSEEQQEPQNKGNVEGRNEMTTKEPQVDMEYKPIVVKTPNNLPSTESQNLNNFLKTLKDQYAAVVLAAVLMASVFFNPEAAIAAQSGGRMGGSFPAQRSSPPTRTRSAPQSYSRGYSRGFSSGYVAPRPSYYGSPFVSPYVSPFPFASPFRSPSYIYSSPGVMVQTRGPGLLEFLAFGAFALAVTSAVSGFGNSVTTDIFDDQRGTVSSALGPGVSVAQISVAMEVPRRDDPNSILSVLDRISNTARTDSRVGIQNLSSQVALELLRRKSSIRSASTTYNHYKDRNQAQRQFNNIAIKERGKFERETVSQYGGVNYSPERTSSLPGASGQATMAVVTLIVAIEGDSTKMPNIRSIQDVEDALRRIASDSKVDNCLQSAEILWTPEERTETLTERDVVADYPGLRTI